MVYLTDAYPAYFAVNATDIDTDTMMLVEVDMDRLDPANLHPDEDYLVEAAGLKPREARRKIRNFQHAWQDSLRELGNVAHRGVVPLSAITRISILRHEVMKAQQFAMLFLDTMIGPTISIIHHQMLAYRYCEFVKLWFGDPIDPHMLTSALFDPTPEMENLAAFRKWQEGRDRAIRGWTELANAGCFEVLDLRK